jgi:hypothetical protein
MKQETAIHKTRLHVKQDTGFDFVPSKISISSCRGSMKTTVSKQSSSAWAYDSCKH